MGQAKVEGHHTSRSLPQIGDGLKAIQIREHKELATTCFFLIRNDGSVDDVSYRK